MKIQHIQVSRNKPKHFPSQTCNEKHPAPPPNIPLTILQTKQKNKTKQDKIKWRLQHLGLFRKKLSPFYSIIFLGSNTGLGKKKKKKKHFLLCVFFPFRRVHNIYKNTHQQQSLLRVISSVPRQTLCHQINANKYDANDPTNIILLNTNQLILQMKKLHTFVSKYRNIRRK